MGDREVGVALVEESDLLGHEGSKAFSKT